MDQTPGLRAHDQARNKKRRHDGDEGEEGQREQRRVFHNDGAVRRYILEGNSRTPNRHKQGD